MARKRMIHPNIWEDPAFNKLSHSARILFIGMFSNADDEGFMRADKGSLKRLIFGFDDNTTEINNWIGEIKKNCKNIHFYKVDGEEYAHFTRWEKYQSLRKDRVVATTCPECGTCLSGCQPTVRQVTDNPPTSDRQLPAEEKGSEEKRSSTSHTYSVFDIGCFERLREKDKMSRIDFLEECKKSHDPKIYIISEWADTIQPDFQTIGQWNEFVKRNLKAAKKLEPYAMDQLEKALAKILKAVEKGALGKYTLDTLSKYLD